MTKTANALSKLLLALMLAQAGLGRAFPHAYRDPEWIAATWIGNDWVTLLLAAPLLLGCLLGIRSSPRRRLLVSGVLAYCVYNYAFYLFGARLNAFLPLYVLAIVTAAAALASELARLEASPRPWRWSRLAGSYLVFVGVLLSCVWLGFWAAHVFAEADTPVEPEAFKVVAATDLVLLVPALVLGGAMLWRGHPAGHRVAAVAAVQGGLYLVVLSVNSAVAIDLGMAEAPGELPIWGTLGVLTVLVALALVQRYSVEGEVP